MFEWDGKQHTRQRNPIRRLVVDVVNLFGEFSRRSRRVQRALHTVVWFHRTVHAAQRVLEAANIRREEVCNGEFVTLAAHRILHCERRCGEVRLLQKLACNLIRFGVKIAAKDSGRTCPATQLGGVVQ
jgi:hypothetical protein